MAQSTGNPAHLVSRRTLIGGGLVASVAGVGVLGFAAETGRLPVLTPALPEKADLPPITGVTFQGRPVEGVVPASAGADIIAMNMWASWCPNCRAEHEQLMQLSTVPGLALFGLVSDDTAENVRAYLASAGNPYRYLSLDQNRVYQRAFRQRGVPATLIFRPDRSFVQRFMGEITPARLAGEVLPTIARARQSA
jgi:cytochrome c biogenesis protein CcmG/thiol:disulfide interchange protein DsbE